MDVSYYKNSLSFLRFGFGTFSLAKIADLKEEYQTRQLGRTQAHAYYASVS
jgi:hypothetical protein